MNTKMGFAAMMIVLVIMSACNKYPEGPGLSIRSRAGRVANEWKMEKVMMNGVDVTSSFTNISYTETYDKDGNYSYASTVGSGSGKWAFQNNDTEIKRNGVSGQSTVDMTILRLKQKSFWYKFTDGGDTFEFHLIPN